MDRGLALLGGIGVGAGLMYMLDPQMGRRRRALVCDKMASASNQLGDCLEATGKDLRNRTQGFVAETSAMLQGKPDRPKMNLDILRESWAPATRLLAGAAGGALLTFGLTQRFPTACVLGTLGLGLLARAATNIGLPELTRMGSEKIGELQEQARVEASDSRGGTRPSRLPPNPKATSPQPAL